MSYRCVLQNISCTVFAWTKSRNGWKMPDVLSLFPTSFFIVEGRGRTCYCQKNRNRQNLPCVLKIEHTFPQGLQFHNLQLNNTVYTLVVNKARTLQAYLAGKLCSYTGKVVSPSWHCKRCATMLSMPDSRRGVHSLSSWTFFGNTLSLSN